MSELLSVLMAALIATLAIPKIAGWQAISQDNKLIAITAQEEKLFDTAVSTYVQQNSTAIQAVATPTVPATITVAMLQATNMLTTAFSPLNPYGQTWQAQVLQPSAGNLQVLAFSTGGQTLSDTQVNKISMLVPSGGFIPSNDGGAYPTAANNAIGARASWNVPTAGYTGIAGGHVAALFSVNQGQLMNSYLYRNAVPGQPQLNTMNTPLIMAAVGTAGSACPSVGAIAQDGSGGVLQCPTALTWATVGGGQWKSPVANYAALPAAGNTLGDVRLTNDVQRAYAWNGASWAALAVDQNGNLSITGNLSAKTLTPTLVVADGSSCAGYPSGAQAQSSITPGLTLSCQSGVWTKASGTSGGIYNGTTFSGVVTASCSVNWTNATCTATSSCPAGHSPLGGFIGCIGSGSCSQTGATTGKAIGTSNGIAVAVTINTFCN